MVWIISIIIDLYASERPIEFPARYFTNFFLDASLMLSFLTEHTTFLLSKDEYTVIPLNMDQLNAYILYIKHSTFR